jgi:aryl-alcohol dehydrogenase
MINARNQQEWKSREIVAAVTRVPGGPFTIEKVQLRSPQSGEVVVKIVGVGVCHTDIAFRNQFIPYNLPAVFGHEGAGIVVEVGAGVVNVEPGDRVIISFASCGICDRCAKNYTSYCRSFALLNYRGRRPGDGSSAIFTSQEELSSHFFGQSSFADYAITSSRSLVKVNDSSLPLAILGPLACGVQTGAGSVLNALACQPGSSIAVLGAGAVGLSSVMAAVIAGCSAVAVVETFATRRALALELGATHVIDPVGGGITDELLEISSAGFDFVLDTTGNPAVIEDGMGALGNRGTLGLLGLPQNRSDKFNSNITALIASGARIVGIMEGNSNPQEFIPQLLSYFRSERFPFQKLITTFSLQEINRAVALQSSGDVVKVVLLP